MQLIRVKERVPIILCEAIHHAGHGFGRFSRIHCSAKIKLSPVQNPQRVFLGPSMVEVAFFHEFLDFVFRNLDVWWPPDGSFEFCCLTKDAAWADTVRAGIDGGVSGLIGLAVGTFVQRDLSLN